MPFRPLHLRPLVARLCWPALVALTATLGCNSTVNLELDLIEPTDQAGQALSGIGTLRIEKTPIDSITGLPDEGSEANDGVTISVDEAGPTDLRFELSEEVFITVKAFQGDAAADPSIINGAPQSIGRSLPIIGQNLVSQGTVGDPITLPVGLHRSFGQTTMMDDEGKTMPSTMDNGAAVPGRHGHSVTYMPTVGKVLILGGAVWVVDESANASLPQCKVFPDGVQRCFSLLTTSEIYDPATGTFTRLPPEQDLLPARAYHTATALPDGRVLVAGGFTFIRESDSAPPSLQALISGFIYDPEANSFSSPITLPSARAMHSAVLIGDQGDQGQVALIGGCRPVLGQGCTPWGVTAQGMEPEDDPVNAVGDVVELFDVAEGSFSSVNFEEEFEADLARSLHATSRMGRFVVISGGVTGQGPRCNVEILEPSQGTLVRPASYPDEASRTLVDCPVGHTQVDISADSVGGQRDNKVALIGGVLVADDGVVLDTTEPTNQVQIWRGTGVEEGPQLLSARVWHRSVVLSDKTILNVGGRIPLGGTASDVLVLDAEGNYGADGLELPLSDSRLDMGVVLMPNNQMLVTGGYSEGGETSARADIFFGQ